ncbi:MAG: type II toxin-antitoxin system HicB family antitoxin [Bacteroidia bacterium]
MRNDTYKYELIIYWDNKDKLYVVEVPELPGCMAHGKKYSDAVVHVTSAIDLWIATAKEFGKPIPKPKGERLVA